MKTSNRFIVIDDDLINNLLCRIVIKKAVGELEIKTFDFPEAGLEYIEKEYADSENETPTILFLDINMHVLNGWEFLDNFGKLNNRIRRQIKIYVLSSSVDAKDIALAKSNRNIVDYITKPLTTKIVSKIIINQNSLSPATSQCSFEQHSRICG